MLGSRGDTCHRGHLHATLMLDELAPGPQNPPMTKKPTAAETRKARLAKALKANLQKRKAQAKARKLPGD